MSIITICRGPSLMTGILAVHSQRLSSPGGAQAPRRAPQALLYCREELLRHSTFHAVFEATKGLAERLRAESADAAADCNQCLSGVYWQVASRQLRPIFWAVLVSMVGQVCSPVDPLDRDVTVDGPARRSGCSPRIRGSRPAICLGRRSVGRSAAGGCGRR